MTLKQRVGGLPGAESGCTTATRRCTELIDTALKVEGMPRHASTHAAGVVITPEPTDYYLPLATNDGLPVTQFNMTEIEELGLLKMDFLGLRTLTVIRDAEIAVQKPRTRTFSIWPSWTTTTRHTYKMLARGETEGVFQLESSGMKQVLVGLQPQNLEDVIALISLYRPGPMDSIPTYLRNRHEPDKISYKTPAAGAHPGCDQRLHRLSGAGHADFPGAGWLLIRPGR